jgi:hypothetical protein
MQESSVSAFLLDFLLECCCYSHLSCIRTSMTLSSSMCGSIFVMRVYGT